MGAPLVGRISRDSQQRRDAPVSRWPGYCFPAAALFRRLPVNYIFSLTRRLEAERSEDLASGVYSFIEDCSCISLSIASTIPAW
jgi:hypothetical protein